MFVEAPLSLVVRLAKQRFDCQQKLEQPSNLLHGDTTMSILGILVSIAAIGTMCWLLFNLAIFALPFFITPAGMVGFYASLGIVKHMMPSETWQLIF